LVLNDERTKQLGVIADSGGGHGHQASLSLPAARSRRHLFRKPRCIDRDLGGSSAEIAATQSQGKRSL
jgi:hypothetical protein